MTLLRRFLRQPKQLWIRKVNFQIHRWTGIVLALYLTAMGLTGSILVFSDELTGMSAHRPWHISAKEPWADASIIIGSLAATYPHTHILSVMAPTKAEPFYLAILQIRERTTVACHPVTGRVLGELRSTRTWLDLVREFHENLFLRRTGRILNGTAAAFLLLLIFSGLVNWWPGVKKLALCHYGRLPKEMAETHLRLTQRRRLLGRGILVHLGIHRSLFCLARE